MIPVGDLKFIHRVYWSTLEFRRDENGKVTSVLFDHYLGVKQ